jgi:hypothetical protein
MKKRLKLSVVLLAIVVFYGCTASMPDPGKPEDPAYSNRDRGGDGGGGGSGM